MFTSALAVTACEEKLIPLEWDVFHFKAAINIWGVLLRWGADQKILQ